MIRSLRFSPFFLLLMLWLSGPRIAQAQSGCSFTLDPLSPPFACLGGVYEVRFSAPCLTGPFRVEISQCAPPFYTFFPPDTSYIIAGAPATITIPKSRDTNCIRGIRVIHIATGAASNVKTIQYLPVDNGPKPQSQISIVSPLKDLYCPKDSILFKIDTIIISNSNPPPTFQWLLNGTPVPGATRAAFVYAQWKPGDCIRLLVTKGNQCARNDTGSSPSICLNIAKKPRATLVIAGNGSGCADSNTTFRLDTADVGLATTFRWFINGIPVPGQTGITFAYTAGLASCGDMIMGRAYTQSCPDSATGGPLPLKGCGKVRVGNVIPLTSCAGDSLKIDYTTLACFNADNVFTFELSDQNGSFANPTILGTVADSNGGRFNTVSPEDLQGGFGFHIRIRSSSPAGISLNISDTLEIYTRPGSPFPQNAQRCGPGRLTLGVNVAGAASYAWYTTQRGFGNVRVRYPGTGGSQGGGALVTTDTFSITLTQDTAFYVVAISPFGCESRIRSTVRATINPPLVVSAGPDQQACEGGSCIPLTGASPSPGTWSGTGVVGGTFCPGALAPGAYIVQYKYVSTEGCSDSATKSITINAVPAPDAGTPDSSVCVPGPPFRFTLRGATPAGGIWSGSAALLDNQGTYNPSLMPTGPDTIFYTIVLAGCSRSDFRVLNAVPSPVFDVNVTNASACLVADGSATVAPFNGATQTVVFYNSVNDTVSTSATATGLAPGTYRVVVSTNGITCATEKTFIVDDPAGPAPVIQGLNAAYCSSDIPVTLTATVLGGTWSSSPANLVNPVTGIFNPGNAPTGPVNIFYVVTEFGTGCIGADTASTTINQAPGLEPEIDTTVCQNAPNIRLSAGGVWIGPGVSLGANGYFFNPDSLGAALVNILTKTATLNGCSTTVSRTILVNPIPVISLTPTGTITICAGGTATVSATLSVPVPGAFYTLLNDTGGSVLSNSTGIFQVSQAGTYRIMVMTGPCGDTSSASVMVNVITLPTVSAGADTIICRNSGLFALFGSPGGPPFSTRWIGDNVVNGNLINPSFDPTNAAAQTIVRYVVQSGACSDSASKLIRVSDPLVASLAASQLTTCSMPVTLTASPSGGNFLYFFYKDGVQQLPLAGSPSPVYTVSSTGSYQVSVIPQTSGGLPACGDTSASVIITIDRLPPTDSLLTLVNLSACRNDASIALPTAPSPYITTWFGIGVVGGPPDPYFFSPQVAGQGIQRLRVTLSNGSCSRTDSIQAGVGSTPKFTLKRKDATSCVSNDGSATVVYANAGSDFFITIIPTRGIIVRSGDSTLITGLPQGQYSVTVANRTSLCDTTISFRVNNPNTFRARIAGIDSAYCINDNPIIATGAPNGPRPFPFSLIPEIRTYGNPAVIDPASLSPGIYILTYEQDSGGCLAVDSVRFRIRPLPVADIVQDTVTVCAGSPGTFNAVVVPGATYSWTFGGTPFSTNPSITVSNPGSYSLTVLSADSCVSNTVFGFLRALPAPVASINVVGNDTSCIGNSITLSAGGAGTPSWSGPTGNLGGTPTIQATASGTYTLILSNAVCSDTATQVLTFTPRPSARVTASGSLTFCQGDSVTLTGGPNFTNVRYVWSIQAGDSLTNTPFLVIRDSRTVILRVIDLTTGCDSSSAPITTIVQPKPLRGIQVLGNVNFCTGGFVDLNAVEPSGTYLWRTIPTGLLVDGQTTRGIRVTQSGQYYVIINPAGCSVTSDSVIVAVDSVPTARILDEISPLSICQGTVKTLNAQQGNGNTYQWFIGTTPQTDSTRSSFVLPTNIPNSYTVTVVVTAPGGACSQTSQPINVTVNPTPQATIFALTDTTVCPGTNVILGGNNTPGTVPSWLQDGNPFGPSANFLTVNAAGDYSYVLTQGGCADTSRSIAVRVINLGTVFAGNDTIVCISDPIFSLTGYSPALSDSVRFEGAGTVAGTNQFNPLVAGQGPKSIFIVKTARGCSVRDEKIITVVPGFAVTIDPVSTTICAQTFTTLTPTIFPREPSITYTFQWFRNDTIINGATSETFTADNRGTYTVLVSGGTCSSLSLPAQINFRPFTPVSIGPDVSLCRNQGTYTIIASGITGGTFQGTDVDPATGAINLVTATGGPREVIYVTDQDGCIIRDTALITINDNPTANATFTNQTTGVEGQALDIGSEAKLVATPGGSSYTWTPPVTTGPGANEATVAPVVTTTYTVTITSDSGCTATGSVTVDVRTDVRVANAFTPNSDSENDTWNIYNISAYPNADIRVFNRWGAIVYETKGSRYTSNPWDGTSKGTKLPVGPYYYTVDLNNNTKPFIGDVSLVR